MNLLTFAMGNLRRRPARTCLTISAISIGIAAVVALTSIAWGFEASWQKANDARGTDLIVTKIASENTMPAPFPAIRLQQAIQSFPHVRQVVGLLSEMLSVGDNSPPMFVFGWAYRSYLWDHLKLLDGHWPDSDSDPEILIGSLASEMLHKRRGDTVEIEGRLFQVVGIFESSALVENGALLMTLTQAQEITDKPGKVNVLNVKLDAEATEANINDFKKRIKDTQPGYAAITSGELVSQNAVVRISKAMSNATILIASLIGALVVLNSMLTSISERTREVGILLALGWRRQTIMALILGESIFLTFVGGLLGIGIGVGICRMLNQLELLRGKIDPILSIPFLFAVIGLSLLVGILGGLYPAFKASSLLPSQAIRQE